MKKLNSIILAILVAMAIPSAAFAIEPSTSVTSSGNIEDVHVVTLSREVAGVFRIPRGKTFIMTDIIIPLNPGAGRDRVYFAHSLTGRAREYWVFPNDRPLQAHFTTGLPRLASCAVVFGAVDANSRLGCCAIGRVHGVLRFKTLRICAPSGECGLTALKQTALDNKRLLADPTPKTPVSRFDFPAILGLGLET